MALTPHVKSSWANVNARFGASGTATASPSAVRAAVPGAPMQACDFPNVGRRGPGGGPIQYWIDFARRLGFLDEDEVDWPAAAS